MHTYTRQVYASRGGLPAVLLCILYIHTIYTHIYTHIYTRSKPRESASTESLPAHLCTCMCMYMCVNIHIHTNIHTYAPRQARVLFAWRSGSVTFNSSITRAINRYQSLILKTYWNLWTEFAQSKEERAEHARGILNKMKNWLLHSAFRTFAQRCRLV